MAQQVINIGVVPNDGTGDALRVALDKTNTNFQELYGVADDLGTAAALDIEDLATAAQGAKADTAVQPARQVSTGTGLTGGGSLADDRTLALSTAALTSLAKAETAVQPSENLADLDDAGEARDNLGLGTAATRDDAYFASAAQGELADDALPRLDPLFLVGGSRYPQTIDQRLKKSSLVAADVVASKYAFSGAAAIDGLTWVNAIMPGTDGVGVVTNYAISPNGKYAAVNAVRSSDNVSPTPQNILAHTDVAMVDNPNVGHLVWGRYTHAWWAANAHPDSFLLGEESSLHNAGADAPKKTPFELRGGSSNAGQRANLRLTAGTGNVVSNRQTCALQITANNGKYASGIIVASDALDTTSGQADVVAMSVNHGMSWYSAGSTDRLWRIFMNVTSVTNEGQIILGDGQMQMFQADLDLATSSKVLKVGGVQVVKSRETGWAANTGGARKTAISVFSDTATASYNQAQIQTFMNSFQAHSEKFKSLLDALISHGLIGA